MKSESGCESEIGRLSSSGICPVMIAGTACQVLVLTVVVLRNQCESSASAREVRGTARDRSRRPLSRSDSRGSSSSTTITTGAGLPTSTAGDGFVRPQEARGRRRGQEQEQEPERSQGREGQPQLHRRETARRRPLRRPRAGSRRRTSADAVAEGPSGLHARTPPPAPTMNTRCTTRRARTPSTRRTTTSHEPQAQRGQERDRQPEQHDLRRRGPPEGELLHPSAEDVEQRLGEREAAQGEQLDEGAEPGVARFGPRQRSAFPVSSVGSGIDPVASPSPPGSGAPRRSSSTGP